MFLYYIRVLVKAVFVIYVAYLNAAERMNMKRLISISLTVAMMFVFSIPVHGYEDTVTEIRFSDYDFLKNSMR